MSLEREAEEHKIAQEAALAPFVKTYKCVAALYVLPPLAGLSHAKHDRYKW